MPWKTFLKAHWDVIAASDMFTVELLLGRSLVRYHILVAIEMPASAPVHPNVTRTEASLGIRAFNMAQKGCSVQIEACPRL